MIVVTGGAGFIGSRITRALVGSGEQVTIVDDASRAACNPNLSGIEVHDHLRQDEFIDAASADPDAALADVTAVVHQGACSDTTEADEDFLWRNNVEWSLRLLDACQRAHVPLVYASSASVYGDGASFVEQPGSERPLNGYARSKATLDAAVRALGSAQTSQVVGLRYFNVYGPGERHKGHMASMALQLTDQVQAAGVARIFGATPGVGAGEQARDFVHVDDVVEVVRWFLAHDEVSGIYNCGTGQARTFNALAQSVIEGVGSGRVEHVPFPDELRGRYQAWTEADLTRLRAAGCAHSFRSLEDGVASYTAHLLAEGLIP